MDFGTNDGFTVVEYFCSGVWNAPEGLEEFSVTSIGGGGGGGFGSSAGGGGAGAIVTQAFSNINQRPSPLTTFGLPANTNFTVTVGNGGPGATSTARSINGLPSGIAGTFANYSGAIQSINSSAPGGGGGGSSNNASFRNGLSGGSGGGGARQGSDNGTGGVAGSSGTTNMGANGGTGPGGRLYGAGGGGAGGPGTTNQGNNSAGRGGNGIQLNSISALSSITSFFGAGGGGTMVGPGGSANSGGSSIGGNGNLTGIGGAGTINTGSGGGAGSTGGGTGGSGRVFIYYQNFRILPVEFLSFTAVYSESLRAGVLNWSTAREWGNSHFEIERAINEVETWETIGKIDGAGYADQTSSYSFTDYRIPPTGGTVFYRIRQVDLDGTTSASETRGIRVESLPSSGTWVAYPNPSNKGNYLHVQLANPLRYADEAILVQISDATAVYNQTFSVKNPRQVEEAVNQFLVNKKSGIYVLTVIWGNQQETLKLLIL